MPIEVVCRQCRLRVRLKDSAAGKRWRCSECGTIVTVPEPWEDYDTGEYSDDRPPSTSHNSLDDFWEERRSQPRQSQGRPRRRRRSKKSHRTLIAVAGVGGGIVLLVTLFLVSAMIRGPRWNAHRDEALIATFGAETGFARYTVRLPQDYYVSMTIMEPVPGPKDDAEARWVPAEGRRIARFRMSVRHHPRYRKGMTAWNLETGMLDIAEIIGVTDGSWEMGNGPVDKSMNPRIGQIAGIDFQRFEWNDENGRKNVRFIAFLDGTKIILSGDVPLDDPESRFEELKQIALTFRYGSNDFVIPRVRPR